MRLVTLLGPLVLCGCSSVAPPVVDKTTVSPQQYAADEAQCVRDNTGGITFGAPITACMRAKGYTILVPNG